MDIQIDDVSGSEITGLLTEHLQEMVLVSPPGTAYVLDLDALRQKGVTVWSAWDGGVLAGCGALKELDARHGEIKSMRTARTHRSRGVAARILEHIIGEATRRGYQRLSLETGSYAFFEPARRLYRRFGFCECGPFGAYALNPNSTFMTREV